MKVIFLDVDGVLNTIETFGLFGPDFIDDASVALVARIVKETGAKIVLSSSWRIYEKDKKMVKKALARHDLEIFDCTPIKSQVKRSEEIQSWLNDNQVKKFAILDDNPRANVEGSFFQIDEIIGLTVGITERVIAHLNS